MLIFAYIFLSLSVIFTCFSFNFHHIGHSQFQARGTPHFHSLICISNHDGMDSTSVDSDLVCEQNKVIDYVRGVLSANFVAALGRIDERSPLILAFDDVPDESDYDWNPSKEYFP